MPESNTTEERELSYGEKAVGITFNPGGSEEVNSCKTIFAGAIDQLDAMRVPTNSAEKNRLLSAAITQIQTAQMWAVKAITWQD
jgi:hypothetical protein